MQIPLCCPQLVLALLYDLHEGVTASDKNEKERLRCLCIGVVYEGRLSEILTPPPPPTHTLALRALG